MLGLCNHLQTAMHEHVVRMYVREIYSCFQQYIHEWFTKLYNLVTASANYCMNVCMLLVILCVVV